MEDRLRKYARLAVQGGVHLQKGQTLMIHADVMAAPFVRMVTEEAYACGAREVVVRYGDEQITRLHYLHQSQETLCQVHDWELESRLDYLKEGACVLHIISDTPGIFSDCDSARIAASRLAYAKASKEVQRYTMNNECAWSIVAVPSAAWAKQVFPECEEPEAVEKLWEAILASVHVDADSDPLNNWEKRNQMFQRRVDALNARRFEALHFTSELGTDLRVALVEDHLWEGGSEETSGGVRFNPNLPTEEVFTMPHRMGVDGIVYASRPLDHNGVLIRDFYIRFENGKAVEFDAKEGKDTLAELLAFDEGSCRLGEVALVPYDSPISLSKRLFYNTLFDENASCHLALGDAYPSCLKGGLQLSQEELLAVGANHSMTHVDFMFGTPQLRVTGIRDEKETLIMEHGCFCESFR